MSDVELQVCSLRSHKAVGKLFLLIYVSESLAVNVLCYYCGLQLVTCSAFWVLLHVHKTHYINLLLLLKFTVIYYYLG